jgi:hypothetical protein
MIGNTLFLMMIHLSKDNWPRFLVPYSRKPAIKNKKAGDSFEIKYLT